MAFSNSKETTFPKGKDWLLERMSQSDFRVDESEFCYGFSWMALFAILLNDIDNLNQKLLLLLTILPENFSKEIAGAKRKIINIFITARKKIQLEMVKEINLPADIKPKDFEKSLNARQKAIFWEAVHQEITRLKEEEDFVEAQAKLDMLAYLEQIEFYQHKKLFHHLLEETPLKKKNPLKSGSTTLVNLPIALQLEGGMSQIKLFSGIYDQKNLLIYFKTLRDVFSQEPAFQIPLALTLNNTNHTVTIGFLNNRWVIFDSNGIDLRPIDEDEIATSRVFLALSSDSTEKVIISTKIYCTEKNKIIMEKYLNAWQALPQYLAIHQ